MWSDEMFVEEKFLKPGEPIYSIVAGKIQMLAHNWF